MTRQPTPANILDNVLTTDVAPDRTALRSRLRWDYAQVAPVDRKAVEDAAVDILANGQRMQQSAVAVGERLIAVKRLLGHGQFGDWCTTEFSMSQKTAENLMNVAREFGDKIETVSIFTNSAMYMLAAPSTPEPARQQAIAEAQATGKSPTKERVREIIAEHKPAPAVPPIPTPSAREYAAAVQGRERFTLSTDDLPDDLVAAGWTVRSKDLGSYWVVNETHGMESAIVRSWDGFAELCASLQKRLPGHAQIMASAISNQQSPISNPAPVTVDVLPPSEERGDPSRTLDRFVRQDAQENAPDPALRIRGYSVLDDYALRDMQPAHTVNAYDALTVPDGRVSAARHLMALYGAVIDSEEQYGSLTGRFSDTLGVKRDLTNMIAHLADLIAAIEHPEEVTPDA